MRIYRIQDPTDDNVAAQIVATLAEVDPWIKVVPEPYRAGVNVELIELPPLTRDVYVWQANSAEGAVPAGSRILRAWKGTARGGLRELDAANIIQRYLEKPNA